MRRPGLRIWENLSYIEEELERVLKDVERMNFGMARAKVDELIDWIEDWKRRIESKWKREVRA
jgi:hypothetical protein